MSTMCEQKVCSVCLDTPLGVVKLINCNHTFCKDCIYKWINIKGTCPNCRTPVSRCEIGQALEYEIIIGNIITVKNNIYIVDFEDPTFYDFCEELGLIYFDYWVSENDFNKSKQLIQENTTGTDILEINFEYIRTENYFDDVPVSYDGVRKFISRYKIINYLNN